MTPLKVIFVLSIAASFLIRPNLLQADTIYSYKSPAYDQCRGTYCSGGPYALSFTFDVAPGAPLENLTLFDAGSDVTADVSWFTFTDGSGLKIDQTNAASYGFQIGTDASGTMTTWSVWAEAMIPGSPEPTLEDVGSNSYTTATYVDYSMVGPGPDDASQNLGYWAPMPESSTLRDLSVDLLGLVTAALILGFKRSSSVGDSAGQEGSK
ncbi:MAG: hypothetical protein KGM47_14840 [Acidobacteriota bacterium]|nr:hypothetical protein [Acidobacteriota bacterium]